MIISKKRVSELFDSFKNKKVLIIGDVMLDSYMWGKVNRISPEAPIPVVSVAKTEYRLGGAANVALNIKSMGANPILCCVTGIDKYADIFNDLLKIRGIGNDGVISEEGRKTTVKTRIISKGQHLLRVDEEDTFPVSNEIENLLLDRVLEITEKQKPGLIIFEDYDKGLISESMIKTVISIAKNSGIKVCVDPKKLNFNNYQGANLFKPNFAEFCEGIKIDIDKSDILKLAKASKKFMRDNDIEILMITLSEHGIFIADKNTHHHFPAEIRDISDVSGAGDTVISIAGLCLSVDASITETAIISNIAGGLVCEKTGVVPINIDELLNEFR
jgi:D-glycero-beta-D-manno-heptose-7-phosphate kinase